MLEQQSFTFPDFIEMNEFATRDPFCRGRIRVIIVDGESWITRLDEQNERILIQLKAVQQLVDTCKQAFQKMLADTDFEEWRCGFKRRPKRP